MRNMINKLRVLNERALAVVTAAPDFDPLKKLNSISNQLAMSDFKGEVLFDLFFRNGLTDNRFAVLPFNGREFNRSLFSMHAKVDDSLQREQDQFIKNEPMFLERSVLSSAEIHKFLSN